MCKAHRWWNIVAALVVLVPAVVVPIAAWKLARRPAPVRSAVAPQQLRRSVPTADNMSTARNMPTAWTVSVFWSQPPG
jgi:hypothetical protein